MAELNGVPVRVDELQTLALTNFGHFTTMRVEAGRVRGLALHLARLVRDCRAVFDADLDPERVRAYARRAAPADAVTMIRVTVFDPALDIGHLGAAAEPRVLVTTRPAGGLALLPLRVRSVPYVRDLPAVKSVGLFGALHHRREAQRAGFDDALFVDRQQRVSEGGTWNIGFVRGSQVVWADADHLPGTTMELLRRARPHRTEAVPPTDLDGFDAAFATNAAIGVRPIAAVDKVAFPDDHPMIAALRDDYRDLPGDPL
ncbi:aminotransferase class IV [Kitasatospora sp. NPDC050463]|uniref:aminotransferase class IV n=1 Tax=Kitasatospora sp. NPDC050463 TaxID=3155786 RepID=UPI0033FDD682